MLLATRKCAILKIISEDSKMNRIWITSIFFILAGCHGSKDIWDFRYQQRGKIQTPQVQGSGYITDATGTYEVMMGPKLYNPKTGREDQSFIRVRKLYDRRTDQSYRVPN